MTDNLTFKQIKVLEELVRINVEERVRPSDFSPLVFGFLFQSFISDWTHYTALEKIVFIAVWSPLLHLLVAFLMKI